MTAIYYAFAAGIGVGFVIALGAIAIMAALTMREEEPADQPQGYVDQDGERTPARHQWANAGAKAHHAE